MAQYTQYSGYDDNQYGEQRDPPTNFGVHNVARPMVDPEAEGEVDLNL
jgi:hypothetical protein